MRRDLSRRAFAGNGPPVAGKDKPSAEGLRILIVK
jgi:hypothetical protein